jgi:hypothetical protein
MLLARYDSKNGVLLAVGRCLVPMIDDMALPHIAPVITESEKVLASPSLSESVKKLFAPREMTPERRNVLEEMRNADSSVRDQR